MESVPKSPRSDGKFPNLPSVTPSLEASPAGAAAWEHMVTGQESEDKGPTAFGGHHCSHPGPLGPAMVSWVNSPGLGPIRSLNMIGEDMHGLSADPADLGEPIRSGCGDKFNVFSALYDVDIGNQSITSRARLDAKGPAALSNPGNLNQPIRLHAPQDVRAQCTLYGPRDLAQTINSSGTTCNSMHMASSEFSNLDEPITPDDAMEVDSANILINDFNLAGPITPDNAMDVDSPNVLINKCNLNEPIKPLDAMETDTPNVLSNNCNSDGPIRPGTAGSKFAHPDQAGCPTPGHPIRSCDAKKTNAPNVLSNYCNLDEPIRSGTANTNYVHTDQAGHPVPNWPIKPHNTMTSNVPNLLHYDCNTDKPIKSGAAGENYTHTILSQSIRYKKDPHWPNQFSSYSSESMDTFHTPPEWFDPFWVEINQPRMDGKSQVTLDAKQNPPKSGKKHCGPNQSDGPKERPGLSAVKILRQLMMTISLEDLCTESPKFCQKMHQAISTLRPGKYEALFLTGTGALRTTGTVNGVHTSIILDSGAYSNIISKMFLESLPWPEVTSSDVSFILVDGSCTTALGKAIKLCLWLGGVFSTIEAAIFDHNQYTLLLGRKTMSDLSVTTRFADNGWTLEHNNELIDLKVTLDSPTGPSFLCKPLAAQIKDNTWLNNVQQAHLQEVISAYSSHIVSDYNDLPEAPGFCHEIDTGDPKPVASRFYHLSQSKE
ncbi:hypothetical protein DSO57_1034639 [Entomophthora muscae]|uniref:Uncharacterized protein n=1 Tax=Entomophthora muscae TaxID=34485 RepID=A0ACC2RQR7_9FUNG|nr:hypothetical protein DSO57_1034639 [Entomophthora muscae]